MASTSDVKPSTEDEDEDETPEPVSPSTGATEDETSSSFVLKVSEKRALQEFRTRLEEVILSNQLLRQDCDPNAASGSSRRNKSFRRRRMWRRHSTGRSAPIVTSPTAKQCESGATAVDSCAVDLSADSAGGSLRDVSLWGVPLLPSRNHEGTDIVLLKFLRAREFDVSAALEMLRRSLRWRREMAVDEILEEEELGSSVADGDFSRLAYIDGVDRRGRPLCYYTYGPAFRDRTAYDEAFGAEESREKFLRWQVMLMEKGIKQLSLRQGGVGSMLHIFDLKDLPVATMKEIQIVSARAVTVLQDNYPEFVAKSIFLNVSFRYYAHHALFSRRLTQRTRSKFVFARPSKVPETLLKFVSPEKLPVQYGGLKRDGDTEFSSDDSAGISELSLRPGGTDCIEIPVDEPGVTVLWDVTVAGWDVGYKEEFVPDDEGSYKVLLVHEKEKKMSEENVRNSFYISEPGRIVITIENKNFKRKKVYSRFKCKPITIPIYGLRSSNDL